MSESMVEATCHCRAIRLRVDHAPLRLTECNCSICRRYGALWAYYRLAEVVIEGGATDIYQWDDREIEFHRCRVCGCVTHWFPVDRNSDRLGVNARLLPAELLASVERHPFDGASYGGTTH